MDKPIYFEKPIFDPPRIEANTELFKSILDEDVDAEETEVTKQEDATCHSK